jgi:hypothetical protein
MTVKASQTFNFFYKRKLTYFVKADSAHLGQYEGQLSHVTRLQGGAEPDQVTQCIALRYSGIIRCCGLDS